MSLPMVKKYFFVTYERNYNLNLIYILVLKLLCKITDDLFCSNLLQFSIMLYIFTSNISYNIFT